MSKLPYHYEEPRQPAPTFADVAAVYAWDIAEALFVAVMAILAASGLLGGAMILADVLQ